MKMSERRYWVTGMSALAAALLYSTIPDWCVDGWVCRLLGGLLMFLTILFGAALGVALALLWRERDKERQSRS